MTQGTAGEPLILRVTFWNDGVPADPSSIELDITYGAVLGTGPEVAGPFTWEGSPYPVAGQVWRTGIGRYAFTWQIPLTAAGGTYFANWTGVFGSPETGSESFTVIGGVNPGVPAGDVGYWTGGLIYAAAGLDIEFGQTDDNGTTWLWQKITGWDGPPVQGAGVIPRSGDHGAWASPQYYAARTPTLTCTASAQSQALRDVARAQLQQAVPVSDLAILRYDEPIPKQALVRRSGTLTEAYPTLADVTFTIGLVAPDMRKYGTVQKSLTITQLPPGAGGGMVVPFTVPFTLDAAPPPGTAFCENAGNFGSPPIVVITGPITAPQLINLTTGQTVSWSQVTVPAGETLTVDFLNRQAWLNALLVPSMPGMSLGGGAYVSADISSAWWVLAPGSNSVELAGIADSAATAEFLWNDAWS